MKGFSIIVCSYNGSNRVSKVINVLTQLKVSNFLFEIIIVDNNSNDDTYNIALQAALLVDKIKVHIIKEEKPGKANALIEGFKYASYDYLVVCDDDNLLNENYLVIADSLFFDYPHIGIIGGKGILPDDYQLPHWFYLHENAWAIGNQHCTSGEIKGEFPSVWGAGMLIRKSVWNQLIDNGFSSFLTGKKTSKVKMAGEDTELCILANSIGYGILYDERLTYIHALPTSRITWKHLLNMKIGFTRSQVYFEYYVMYLNGQLNTRDVFKRHVIKNLFHSICLFFSGYKTKNYYKTLFIAFVEIREGYQPVIDKRNQITRIMELCKVVIRLKSIYAVFTNFKYDHY